MKLTYDQEADAAYLQIANDIKPGESVRQLQLSDEQKAPGHYILDFDRDDKLLGIEILFASDVLPQSVLAATDFEEPSSEADS